MSQGRPPVPESIHAFAVLDAWMHMPSRSSLTHALRAMPLLSLLPNDSVLRRRFSHFPPSPSSGVRGEEGKRGGVTACQ